VSAAADRDAGAIAFAERLLAVLDEGIKVATYECAVLIGLMDLCLEHSSATGMPPIDRRCYWSDCRGGGR